MAKEPNGGLIIVSDPFTLLHRKLIVELAARHKLPAVYGNTIFVEDGGLASYGVDQVEEYRGAAGYVDRILKGLSRVSCRSFRRRRGPLRSQRGILCQPPRPLCHLDDAR
jgi:hypothetical protein